MNTEGCLQSSAYVFNGNSELEVTPKSFHLFPYAGKEKFTVIFGTKQTIELSEIQK